MFVNRNAGSAWVLGVFVGLLLASTALGQLLPSSAPPSAPGGSLLTTATLHGEIRWTAAIPEPVVFEVHQDSYVCGSDGRIERQFARVDTKTRALQGACIYIDRVPGGRAWTDAERQAPREIWFDECSIRPGVVAVPIDGNLTVGSAESVWHIALVPRRGRTEALELDLATRGARRRSRINMTGPIRIQCQRHIWETAYAFGADSPYVDVSDEVGRFRIDDLPPGTYQLEVWHPPVAYTPTIQNGRIVSYVPAPPVRATMKIRKLSDSPLGVQINLPGGELRELPE